MVKIKKVHLRNAYISPYYIISNKPIFIFSSSSTHHKIIEFVLGKNFHHNAC